MTIFRRSYSRAIGSSLVAFAAFALTAVATQAQAADAMDPQIRKQTQDAIEHGLTFLKGRVKPDGSWSKSVGVTALDLRAFLESPHGYTEKDGTFITQPIAFMLSKKRPDGAISEGKVNSGYNTSTAIMALAATHNPVYMPEIVAGQNYLKKIQVQGGSHKDWYGGIGYSDDGTPDMSNQYMALQALKATALDPKDPVWQRALQFINRSQNRSESNDQKWAGNDGGFIYMPGTNTGPFKATESYGTATSAGLISLLYAGVDKQDPRVQDAYKWIRNHYTLDFVPGSQSKAGIYYFYHAFAQSMAAYGEPMIVDANGKQHNWRNELAQKLLSQQRTDGSWINKDSSMWWQDNPDLVTAWSVNALNQVLK